MSGDDPRDDPWYDPDEEEGDDIGNRAAPEPDSPGPNGSMDRPSTTPAAGGPAPLVPPNSALESQPYADLNPDAVLDAVEASGLPVSARIFALNSFENRVYQVGLDDGTSVVAKFYRPNRWTDAQILEEHALSQDMADLDIPAVPPMQIDGSTLLYQGGHRFSLYPFQPGAPPDVEGEDTLRVIGRYLGRLHAVGRVGRFQHRPALDSNDFGHGSRQFLLDAGCIPAELEPAYASLTADLLERIDAVMMQAKHWLEPLRCHGDCHMGNVLWHQGMSWFVDFDDARTAPAIQDLWMLLSGERPDREQQLKVVLEGYRTFADFNPRELVLIEPLRTLRMMHHAAWIARRWADPAFPKAFPWFGDQRYWSEHILSLREQLAALEEPVLRLQH